MATAAPGNRSCSRCYFTTLVPVLPSSDVTRLPAAVLALTTHERTTLPSTITAQQPHWPIGWQPLFWGDDVEAITQQIQQHQLVVHVRLDGPAVQDKINLICGDSAAGGWNDLHDQMIDAAEVGSTPISNRRSASVGRKSLALFQTPRTDECDGQGGDDERECQNPLPAVWIARVQQVVLDEQQRDAGKGFVD